MSPDEQAAPVGLPTDEIPQLPEVLPVLPLRDMVLFPYIILPLSVAREKSIQAVDRSLAENRLLMLVSQRDPALEDPGAADLYEIGTAASITRMLKLPDGRIRVLVQGVMRARVAHLLQPRADGRDARGGIIDADAESTRERFHRQRAIQHVPLRIEVHG